MVDIATMLSHPRARHAAAASSTGQPPREARELDRKPAPDPPVQVDPHGEGRVAASDRRAV
jgi:hypothetical protein